MIFSATFKTTMLALAVIVLALSSMARAEIIASLQAAEEGGPRRLESDTKNLVVYASPSFSAEKLKELSRGTVLSNMGCTVVANQSWCEVRLIRGGVNGFVQAAQVQPAEGPDGTVPQGLNDSKNRARRRDFDQMGEAPCAQEQGQTMGRCRAAVARSGGGDATVVVTFSNGFARDLYFVHGDFIRASATMSGVGTDIDWQFENDTYSIRVDDQRFDVPGAFVLGQ